MAETYALISTRLKADNGFWYLYEKSGFDPMVLFHKEGHHGREVRSCHHTAGWKITPLKTYTVNDSDID